MSLKGSVRINKEVMGMLEDRTRLVSRIMNMQKLA